jgi:dsDNA-specific endonuclease/ATPase MutS2
MSEPFNFLEGAKSLGSALDSARGVSKELSTSIANVQKEATDLAQQRAQERIRAQKVQIDQSILKAFDEFKIIEEVKRLEQKMKAEVIKTYGPKAWDDIQVIKARLIKEKKENEKLFNEDLHKIKRVQFYCFLVAALVAYYLVWGHKG